jgi:hypothetical protein
MEHAGKNTAKTTNYTLSLRMLVIASIIPVTLACFVLII